MTLEYFKEPRHNIRLATYNTVLGKNGQTYVNKINYHSSWLKTSLHNISTMLRRF